MTFVLLTPPDTIVATGRWAAVLAAGVERELVTWERNLPRRGEPVEVPRLARGVRMTVVGDGRRAAA